MRSWFENNTLGKVQLNGRRMSDILSDCQRGKSLEQLRPNLHLYSSSDSTSDSGMASCPEAVADLLDEAAIVCNNQETSGASFHSSSLESGGLQSSYLPTYQSAPGETISQNTDSVSKLTFSEVQTRTHNQADRHGPSFKRYDGLAESSGRTTAKRLPIPFDSEGWCRAFVGLSCVLINLLCEIFEFAPLDGATAAVTYDFQIKMSG